VDANSRENRKQEELAFTTDLDSAGQLAKTQLTRGIL
jgi:hypothetical protein